MADSGSGKADGLTRSGKAGGGSAETEVPAKKADGGNVEAKVQRPKTYQDHQETLPCIISVFCLFVCVCGQGAEAGGRKRSLGACVAEVQRVITISTEAKMNRKMAPNWPENRSPGKLGIALCSISKMLRNVVPSSPETDSKASWEPFSDLSWLQCIWLWCVSALFMPH